MRSTAGNLSLVAVAVLVLCGWPAGATAQRASDTELGDCLLVVDAFPVSPDRVQPRYVPRDYTLTLSGGQATVAFWSLDCGSATVAGAEVGRTQLTLVGVEVDNGDTKSLGGFWPQYWAHYLTSAQTDRGALVGRLAAAGFPAHHVSDMWFGVTPLAAGIASTSVHVGWPKSPFDLSVTPSVPHNVETHDHENLFWHGDWGPAASRLALVIPKARDHFCLGGPECGAASAEPGTEVAALLGASAREDASFAADHEPIARVGLRLPGPPR